MAIAGFLACKKESKKGGTVAGAFNRKAILVNMADSLIIPGYRDFEIKAMELDTKASLFAGRPTEDNLSALRTSWLNAYTTWQRVALWNIGPGMSEAMLSNLNTYPTNVVKIEADIDAGGYNLNDNFAKAVQGFPALEYLIYGDNKDAISIITAFSDAKRAKYLTDLTGKISALASKVKGEWGNSYRNTFVNAEGLDRGSSLGELFNNTFLPYVEMHNREAKFGIPAGQRTPQTFPEKVEGYYSKTYSKQLALAAWEAYKGAWLGTGYTTGKTGSSLADYVAYMDSKKSTQVYTKLRNQLDAIGSTIKGLDNNFNSVAKNNPEKLKEVWSAYQSVITTVKTDIASALSVTISYVDNDGD